MVTDLSQAEWKKAALSAHNGGCVEIAANLPAVTAIRDSKNPARGALAVTKTSFAAFLDGARQGRYTLYPPPGVSPAAAPCRSGGHARAGRPSAP